MLRHLRVSTSARRALIAFAALALALKIVFPAGFMPGTNFAQPIMICSGQGPVVMMMTVDEGGKPQPAKAHTSHDHSCPFAGHGAAPLAPEPVGSIASATRIAAVAEVVPTPSLAPGRGMAAPPPPSHAPPTVHA